MLQLVTQFIQRLLNWDLKTNYLANNFLIFQDFFVGSSLYHLTQVIIPYRLVCELCTTGIAVEQADLAAIAISFSQNQTQKCFNEETILAK